MKSRLGKMGINRITIFLILLVCVIPLSLFADSEVKTTGFVDKVEGAGRVFTAVQTRDGSYVSVSTTDYVSYIVKKISPSGKRIWERALSFQIADGGFVSIDGIAQTNPGYLLVGWGRLGGYYDDGSGVIVKLKNDGTVRWTKAFRPSTSVSEITFRSVSSTADGGFIVRGDSFQPSGAILAKFTPDGNVLWSKFLKDLQDNFSQPVSDGLILAHQFDNSLGVFKVNDSGGIVWEKTLEIKGSYLTTLGGAVENGVVLAGTSSDFSKLVLIGLNANGELQWKSKYLLNVPFFSTSSLLQTSDGGYVITGTKSNPKTGGNRGGLVLRIDSKRNLVFQKTFGLPGIDEEAATVFATPEGGFTVFGSSGPDDMLVLNLNSDGAVPGCGFLHELKAKKVNAPSVTTGKLTIGSENFSLPTPGTIEILSVLSEKETSNACP